MTESHCLAFAIVVGSADHLAVSHVGALLAATLAIDFAHLIVAFDGIAAHLLAIAFLVHLLRLFQLNHLSYLLDGHVVHMMEMVMIIGTGTGYSGSL